MNIAKFKFTGSVYPGNEKASRYVCFFALFLYWWFIMQLLDYWKDVSGYEGYYQINCLGKVKSLKRKGRLKEIIKRQRKNNSGYSIIDLHKNKKTKTTTVQKLMQLVFFDNQELEMDHKNMNKTDNRLNNLRLATKRQNRFNSTSRKGTSSKFKGVYWCKHAKKWIARIRVNGEKKHLGCFKGEEEAAKAYDKVALRTHGEYVRLNVI